MSTSAAVTELLQGTCSVPVAITELTATIRSVKSQLQPAHRGSAKPKTPSGQPRARIVEASRYAEGYRIGKLDRALGIRSEYAEAPEHGHYATGYRHGVLGIEPRDPEPPIRRAAEVQARFDQLDREHWVRTGKLRR